MPSPMEASQISETGGKLFVGSSKGYAGLGTGHLEEKISATRKAMLIGSTSMKAYL